MSGSTNGTCFGCKYLRTTYKGQRDDLTIIPPTYKCNKRRSIDIRSSIPVPLQDECKK